MTIQLKLKKKYLAYKGYGVRKAGGQNSTPKPRSIAAQLQNSARRRSK